MFALGEKKKPYDCLFVFQRWDNTSEGHKKAKSARMILWALFVVCAVLL